ncbi:MAG: glutamate-1-semialdehyde 2,1-aminomutase [Candidatus Hydrogenedentes bacterium]|nr:glutamate-1-semialdehyde 2,1-aminomutase [Candidatus Hydrogenedentota bacterium]
MERAKSAALWQRANDVLVGGVNSPVRAFKAVGGDPFFVASGKGPRITDVDGNEYIDYVLSWGPLILGHAHPRVVEAVAKALEKGSSFGIPTAAEIDLAEKLAGHVECIEKVRLVNSGTEATMSAIRLARGYTGRDIVLKIEGGYHGHVDGLLVAAGSGPTTFGTPTSPGIPKSHVESTLTVPFNDPDAAEEAFEKRGEEIACLILEPVAGNMGCIPPNAHYLEELRRLTKKHGALLIFDEVMTGFRVSMGGAQERFGVTPDLVTLGKVIGGGLPVGAYAGPAEIMDHVSPVGPVYQAGTLSGNPLATAAGLATLEALEAPGVLDEVERALTVFGEGMDSIAKEAGIPVTLTQAGAMAGMFFHEGPVENYQQALKTDTERYAKFFRGMLERGVYFAPSAFEAYFASTEHTDAEIDQTLDAARAVFKTL